MHTGRTAVRCVGDIMAPPRGRAVWHGAIIEV